MNLRARQSVGQWVREGAYPKKDVSAVSVVMAPTTMRMISDCLDTFV